jgi:HSP20 family protein
MTRSAAKNRGRSTKGGLRLLSSDLMLQADGSFDPLAVGVWKPNVDLCETPDLVLVRVELPGVDIADVRVAIQKGAVRIQGIKRETTVSSRLLCYYCLERTYGKFDRQIPIHWVVDARRARAFLGSGVLTVELPKLPDRRGTGLEIPIEKK